jgi:hypothetical protein
MATIRVTLGGVEINSGKEYELCNKALLGIAETQNVASKTVQNALDVLGGESFAEMVAGAGNPDDVVEIYEIPEGKSQERLAARYELGKLAQRIRVAVTVESWSGEIFTEKSGKVEKSATPQKIAFGM